MDERPATQARYPCAVLKQSFLNGLSQIEKLEASAATTALRLEPCSLYEVAKSVITIIAMPRLAVREVTPTPKRCTAKLRRRKRLP